MQLVCGLITSIDAMVDIIMRHVTACFIQNKNHNFINNKSGTNNKPLHRLQTLVLLQDPLGF